VQRAARAEAGAGCAEIPAAARVSRTRLAAGENHTDPDALSQGPAGLVGQIAHIARLARAGTHQK
jgi:hypothetical protein